MPDYSFRGQNRAANLHDTSRVMNPFLRDDGTEAPVPTSWNNLLPIQQGMTPRQVAMGEHLRNPPVVGYQDGQYMPGFVAGMAFPTWNVTPGNRTIDVENEGRIPFTTPRFPAEQSNDVHVGFTGGSGNPTTPTDAPKDSGSLQGTPPGSMNPLLAGFFSNPGGQSAAQPFAGINPISPNMIPSGGNPSLGQFGKFAEGGRLPNTQFGKYTIRFPNGQEMEFTASPEQIAEEIKNGANIVAGPGIGPQTSGGSPNPTPQPASGPRRPPPNVAGPFSMEQPWFPRQGIGYGPLYNRARPGFDAIERWNRRSSDDEYIRDTALPLSWSTDTPWLPDGAELQRHPSDPHVASWVGSRYPNPRGAGSGTAENIPWRRTPRPFNEGDPGVSPSGFRNGLAQHEPNGDTWQWTPRPPPIDHRPPETVESRIPDSIRNAPRGPQPLPRQNTGLFGGLFRYGGQIGLGHGRGMRRGMPSTSNMLNAMRSGTAMRMARPR